MPDLARPDLAEAQMRRKPRGRNIVGAVAAFAITVQGTRQEVTEAFGRCIFARRPGFAQTSGPVRLRRFERQIGERHRHRGNNSRKFEGIEPGRGRDRRGWLAQLARRAPVWREHLHRVAGLGLDLPGLVQKGGVEAFDLRASLDELALKPAIDRDRFGIVAPIPGYEIDLRHLDHARHDRGRVAPHDDEFAAPGRQRRAERLERTRQPPAAGAAERATGATFIEDVEGNRGAVINGSGKRRVVGETKIVAKPVERSGGHGSSAALPLCRPAGHRPVPQCDLTKEAEHWIPAAKESLRQM